jgi:3-oxoacyl-[acyl-carrier protein] reductase
MRLEGKVAIVTGAAGGIGEAIANLFIREGAKVTLCDMNETGLRDVESKINKMNGTCQIAVGSVADREFVERMINDTVDEFGNLDVIVNNAAITRDAMLHKMSTEQWDEVMDVNLRGVFFCLQAAAMHMRARGKGTIINISSTARFGNPGQLNYSVAKGGVVSMTRTAAKELARKNVTCNCISPGTIDTDMLKKVPEDIKEQWKAVIPLGRLGKPKEIANLCLFLASDEASYITGQTINVDGGLWTV